MHWGEKLTVHSIVFNVSKARIAATYYQGDDIVASARTSLESGRLVAFMQTSNLDGTV